MASGQHVRMDPQPFTMAHLGSEGCELILRDMVRRGHAVEEPARDDGRVVDLLAVEHRDRYLPVVARPWLDLALIERIDLDRLVGHLVREIRSKSKGTRSAGLRPIGPGCLDRRRGTQRSRI